MKDDLRDDQSVVIETEKVLFIVLGRCHSRIINTPSYDEAVNSPKNNFSSFRIESGMTPGRVFTASSSL